MVATEFDDPVRRTIEGQTKKIHLSAVSHQPHSVLEF